MRTRLKTAKGGRRKRKEKERKERGKERYLRIHGWMEGTLKQKPSLTRTLERRRRELIERQGGTEQSKKEGS